MVSADSGSSKNGTQNGTLSAAEEVARNAKAAFDAAQMLPDAASERIKSLKLIREALSAAKDDILKANQLDMEVSNESACIVKP